MNKKKISYLRIVVAIIISLVSIAFITYRISVIPENKVRDIYTAFSSFKNIILLVIVVLMMLANWSMEVLKWKLLLKPRVKLSFKKSAESVMAGISLGAITPNRIGEFAGRIFFLKDQDKIFGTVASFTGGFAQNVVTVFSGLVCTIIYLMIYENSIFIETPFIYYLIFVLSVVLIILMMLVYLNLSYFIDKISHWKILRKLEDYLPHTADWSTKDLWKVFLFSFLRYSIFSTQFLILLYVFGVDFPVQEQMVKIGLIFMLTSFIPSYALSDLANRGSVSIAIFNDSTADLAIAAASISLWIINLAIPGLLGNIFLIKGSKTA